jgi:hypothetical protein
MNSKFKSRKSRDLVGLNLEILISKNPEISNAIAITYLKDIAHSLQFKLVESLGNIIENNKRSNGSKVGKSLD